jgi:UDP-N-acetylglucosamine 2-epimerase (non-hydrolysing)
MKICKALVVVGTRPDAIKMAPLYLELKNNPSFQTFLCSSGQHLELLNQALNVFKLKPDFELKAMTEQQSLNGLTSNLLGSFSALYSKLKPDIVLVHGDTSTAFAGALAAFYLNIGVAHIEAGLRTYDISDPFPEEFNRQAIARISQWNFVPTNTALKNLIQEGINEEQIFLSGNTIVDSVRIIKDRILLDSKYRTTQTSKLLQLFGFNPMEKKFILVTLHRRESFGSGVENVCKALKRIAEDHPEIKIIFPVHLNPSVRNDVIRLLDSETNIALVEPIDYDLFIFLAMNCLFIITDSGGIQEEAISLSKRVLVSRNKTERTEGMESGLLKIISTDQVEIIKSANLLLESDHGQVDLEHNPFGSGNVSERIVNILTSKFSG